MYREFKENNIGNQEETCQKKFRSIDKYFSDNNELEFLAEAVLKEIVESYHLDEQILSLSNDYNGADTNGFKKVSYEEMENYIFDNGLIETIKDKILSKITFSYY